MLQPIDEPEDEKGLYDYVPEMAAEDEAVLKKMLEASAKRKAHLTAAGIVEGDDTLLLRVRFFFPTGQLISFCLLRELGINDRAEA